MLPGSPNAQLFPWNSENEVAPAAIRIVSATPVIDVTNVIN